MSKRSKQMVHRFTNNMRWACEYLSNPDGYDIGDAIEIVKCMEAIRQNMILEEILEAIESNRAPDEADAPDKGEQ